MHRYLEVYRSHEANVQDYIPRRGSVMMETVVVMDSRRKDHSRNTDEMQNVELFLEAGKRIQIEHIGCYLIQAG